MKNDVTVLIPLYNDQKHIRKAILSIVNQVEEVIVSDNNSNDASYEICKELAKEYNNIKVFKQEKNLGGMGNLNFLYKHVKTNYVMNMGSHDYVDDDYISTLKKILMMNSDTVMAFSPVVSVDDQDRIISENFLEDFAKGFLHEENIKRVYTAVCMEYNYAFYGLFKTKIFINNIDATLAAGVDHLIMAKCANEGKFIRSVDTRFYLRTLDRVENDEEYMRRLAGKSIQFDISYTFTHLLAIMNSCSSNQQLKDELYAKARLNLIYRYGLNKINALEMVIKSRQKGKDSYILYGGGTDAMSILEELDQKILFVVDKDIKRHGQQIKNLKIYPVEEVLKYPNYKIIVSHIGRFLEISAQIKHDYPYIPEGRIICLETDLI